MDVSEILLQVQNEILDLPDETNDTLIEWINQAIRDAEQDHNFRHMEMDLAATTVALTRLLVAKPANWKEQGEAPYLTYNDGGTLEIQWASSGSDMRRQYAENAKGAPQFILETPTQLRVYPLPDSQSDYPDDQYRVTMPYIGYSIELDPDDAAAVTNYWTENFPWYVIYKAAAYAFMRNYDTVKAQERAGLAGVHFDKAKRKDKRSRLPRRVSLGVSKRVFGPGNRPKGWAPRRGFLP